MLRPAVQATPLNSPITTQGNVDVANKLNNEVSIQFVPELGMSATG